MRIIFPKILGTVGIHGTAPMLQQGLIDPKINMSVMQIPLHLPGDKSFLETSTPVAMPTGAALLGPVAPVCEKTC